MKKCVVLAISLVILIMSAVPVCAATNARPMCSHDRRHVRTVQAIIFRAERVPGRLTDCPELWHKRYVVLNRAITTDGNIWLFYTSYNKKYRRQRRWKAVMLKIHDNYTKTVLDDEVVDVIE